MSEGPPLVGDPERLLAELDDVSPLSKGQEVLGRYTLLFELASGGMATMYLAKVSGPGGFTKLIAIKRIHPHLAKQRHFVEMFLDEARIAARIQHPNVVQIHELGEIDRNLFIAMEYIEGESLARFARTYLAQRRERDQPPLMPIRPCAAIVAAAASGLHAAHELRAADGSPMGLVHRDVSPHNILVTYDGHVKLIDFGVAKARGRIAQTTDKLVKGKVAYMSPEQVTSQPLDRRSDIFALGVVLYEMTCSRRLFKSDVDVNTLAELVKAQVRPPSQVVAGYPAALEQVVMKALARRPEDRFQSADEMRQAIQRFLMGSGPPVGEAELSSLMRETFGERIKLKTQLREKCESNVSDATELLKALGGSDTLDFSAVTARKGQRFSQLLGASSRRRGVIGAAIGALVAATAILAGAFLIGPMLGGPTTGTLKVRSTPPGAAVFVDGEGPLGTTPATLEAVAAGSHTLEVTLADHATWSEQLQVEGGGQVIVDAALQPLPPKLPPLEAAATSPLERKPEAAPADDKPDQRKKTRSKKKRQPEPQGAGKLALQTFPWSEVWLGDRKLGVTPLVGVELPAGRHTLKLLPEGNKPAQTLRVTIEPGGYLRREIKLR